MSGGAVVSAIMSVQFLLLPIWVQYGDSFGKEAVPESVCSGPYGPEAPARGQQVEEMEAGWVVSSGCFWPCWDSRSCRWCLRKAEGSQWFFVRWLPSSAVSSCWPPCSWVPRWHSVGQQALRGGAVEGPQCAAPSWAPSGGVAVAAGPSAQRWGVDGPGEVSRDVAPEDCEALESLYTSTLMHWGAAALLRRRSRRRSSVWVMFSTRLLEAHHSLCRPPVISPTTVHH